MLVLVLEPAVNPNAPNVPVESSCNVNSTPGPEAELTESLEALVLI